MKAVLFCMNPYAFGILNPLYQELISRGHEVLWYTHPSIAAAFPFTQAVSTSSIKEAYEFKSDAIFIPGNEVPHYLRGVKVQVFHGLAGEKKGHFRIRQYFDLYLTQGPYFTNGFEQLARSYKNFEVKETGWCKLDTLYQHHDAYRAERDQLLAASSRKYLILYAPTFSPSLTSAVDAKQQIFELADKEDVFLLIKFHDLMNKQVKEEYRAEASRRTNVTLVEDPNILKVMIMADLMISDTSSVVYEFILLNKPVVTINSQSENINWRDIQDVSMLRTAVMDELQHDSFRANRKKTIEAYHPYTDGKSSGRMIEAVEDYIQRNGIPERRKLNLYRRFKINRTFGKEPQ
jgi:CDP-glycerol glycerophosphotransferase (TagB/SpsB family)